MLAWAQVERRRERSLQARGRLAAAQKSELLPAWRALQRREQAPAVQQAEQWLPVQQGR